MEIMEPIRDLHEDGDDDEEEFMKKDGSSRKSTLVISIKPLLNLFNFLL